MEQITALAKLPNREGLLSMLLSVLQAPVRNVAYAVKAVAEKTKKLLNCSLIQTNKTNNFNLNGGNSKWH